jgi:hypothetical protein
LDCEGKKYAFYEGLLKLKDGNLGVEPYLAALTRYGQQVMSEWQIKGCYTLSPTYR